MELKNHNITIAGGTGFLGQVLIEYFKTRVKHIYVLSRNFRPNSKQVTYLIWNGKNQGEWTQALASSEVLINLAGKSVDCRYTAANKKAIIDSRVDSTKALGLAMHNCKTPPSVWINASTGTIYEHSESTPMDEQNGRLGNNFSEEVAKKWERAFFDFYRREVRQVAVRIAIVLGKKGGALQPIKAISKLGFGGQQGNGNQQISWMHEEDFARAIAFIITHPEQEGIFNLAAPLPIRNRHFMQNLRAILKVPLGINLPKPLLEFGALLIKTETELILKSRYVQPKRLLNAGFKHKYTSPELALKDLLS
ncbi:TIGR01777 family oxidoreductase [Gilvibacter sediminis]|uniref:TIGR01777 family oxidoreductase n=1 Tax=Gilvibacter sediminis TaxID=379071 RepID=UPI0023502A44|nr:TIGR01777 family oxidoreductase [Gilvibacter sediminis]MDC7997592.1 TIGR01777 family oxidoreductase [Gilvibacter sediminis]